MSSKQSDSADSMSKAKDVSFMGVLLALAIVLSILEAGLPPIPFFPPNFKPGLANVVVMYCVMIVGYRQAVLINVLRSLFILILRGPVAGLMSLSGGFLSVFVLILLIGLFANKISYAMLSVISALFHNLGQLLVAGALMDFRLIIFYAPVLLVASVVLGMFTGFILGSIMPALNGLRSRFMI